MENTESPITITDLAVIKNIIDLACSRGAFRANEMKTVGETYDRLSNFLDSVISKAEADKANAVTQGETK